MERRTELDVEMCHKLAAKVYGFFEEEKLSSVEGLGMLAFLVARTISDHIKDEAKLEHVLGEFTKAVIQIRKQIAGESGDEEKKTMN